MRICFAGSESKDMNQVLYSYKVQNRLYSFYTIKNKQDWLEQSAKLFPFIFLDSGGFVARTRGVEIKIEEYGDFIAANKRHVAVYANLDYKDTERTLHNQRYLEARGLSPIPIFHADEWLDRKYDLFDMYLKKYPYIAVGGVAKDISGKSVAPAFLSAVFKQTKNITKVHGFGITSIEYLKKYPFYSVDSTSWNQGGRYGNSLKYENFNVKAHKNKMHMFYKKKKTYKQRDSMNIEAYLRMAQEVNALWKMRGVEWKD